MMGFFTRDQQALPPLPPSLEDEQEAKVPRDQWGRPRILLPGEEPGGKRAPYARASGYGKQIEDNSNLAKWGKRQMLRGVAIDPSIIDRVPQGPARERGGEITRQDKFRLEALVEQADEAVGSSDKATLGTAIHLGTERVDLGGTLEDLSPLVRERANAYWRATREWGLTFHSVEKFGVEDENQVAGTWDRVGYVPFWPQRGMQRILDVKTSSSMDFAGIGFAVQLAEYAHMCEYDDATNTRTPHENMNLDLAGIIHVSREEGGPVTFERVNIRVGWYYASLVRNVIMARREGDKSIHPVDELEMLIGACRTLEELREVFAGADPGQIQPYHRALAKATAAEINGETLQIEGA